MVLNGVCASLSMYNNSYDMDGGGMKHSDAAVIHKIYDRVLHFPPEKRRYQKKGKKAATLRTIYCTFSQYVCRWLLLLLAD